MKLKIDQVSGPQSSEKHVFVTQTPNRAQFGLLISNCSKFNTNLFIIHSTERGARHVWGVKNACVGSRQSGQQGKNDKKIDLKSALASANVYLILFLHIPIKEHCMRYVLNVCGACGHVWFESY
jgi:hypothetical protein